MTLWERLDVDVPLMVRVFGGLPEWDIDKRRTALMIVDMQRYCAAPTEGMWSLAHDKGMGDELAYYYERIELATKNLERLLAAAREHNVEVVHVNGDVALGKRVKERTAAAGKAYQSTGLHEALSRRRSFPHDADVVERLQPLPEEVVIRKRGAGPFGLTNVDNALRALNVEYLIIGGTVTHQCVEMTIRGAFDFGYKVIMVEDGTATTSDELQRNTMIALGDWFCKIMPTDEILEKILIA